MIPVSAHYVPVVLRSAAEICRAFGISRAQLQKWVTEGAPVVVERDGRGVVTRYRSEVLRLYLWLEQREKKSPGGAGD